MKSWRPDWAHLFLAIVLGSWVGVCVGQASCDWPSAAEASPPNRALVREFEELPRIVRAPPPAPPWRHLSRRIGAVNSSARVEGSLQADRIAELIWTHCSDLDVYEVTALAWIESGFRPHAESTDGEDLGIFQLRRRWSNGIDALDLGGAIPGACEKLRRWRTDCHRWHVVCESGARKSICDVHNPETHHWIAHWAGGTAAVKTNGARRVVRRAAILRGEGGGS